MDLTQQLLCATNHDDVRVVFWPYFGGFSLASAIITALLAPNRGRSPFWWFLIGGSAPWISILLLYMFRDLTVPDYPAGPARPVPGPAPGQPAPEARWTSVSEPGVALPQDGWFYALRRQAMGPVSLPYLRGAIEMGSLSRDVPVWCSAFREWVTPRRIPGFFG